MRGKFIAALSAAIALLLMLLLVALGFGLGYIKITDPVAEAQREQHYAELEKSKNEISRENLDKIARTAIHDFVTVNNSIWANPEGVLVGDPLSFYKDYMDLEKNTTYYHEGNYAIYSIDYSEFMERVRRIMTEELFNQKYASLFSQKDGKLKIFLGGATGCTSFVTSVEMTGADNGNYTYKANITSVGHDGSYIETTESFGLKMVEGTLVVSQSNLRSASDFQ